MLNCSDRISSLIKPLIIIGAGASYDLINSDPNFPYRYTYNFRPPLTINLFNKEKEFYTIQEKFPLIHDVIAYVRHEIIKGLSFEEAIEKWRNDQRDRNLDSKIIEFKKYLKELFSEISSKNINIPGNNYSYLISLLSKIRRDYLIVNFNYDSILLNALRSIPSENDFIEVDYDTPNKYSSSQSPIQLIHIHGCHEWEDRNGLPNISLPTISKTERDFVCLKSHIENLKSYLLSTDTIIIIGWRGKEEHFKEILIDPSNLSKLNKIIIIDEPKENKSGEFAVVREILNNSGLLEKIKNNKCEIIYIGGFSNLFIHYTDFAVPPLSEHIIHFSKIID